MHPTLNKDDIHGTPKLISNNLPFSQPFKRNIGDLHLNFIFYSFACHGGVLEKVSFFVTNSKRKLICLLLFDSCGWETAL